MPLLCAAMYAKGVQLYCALTVDDRDKVDCDDATHCARTTMLRAFRVPVHASRRLSRGLLRGGGRPARNSADPGRQRDCQPAGPHSNYEGKCLQLAHLDLGEIAERKSDLDVVGLRAAAAGSATCSVAFLQLADPRATAGLQRYASNWNSVQTYASKSPRLRGCQPRKPAGG
jgi:hypothetical protein